MLDIPDGTTIPGINYKNNEASARADYDGYSNTTAILNSGYATATCGYQLISDKTFVDNVNTGYCPSMGQYDLMVTYRYPIRIVLCLMGLVYKNCAAPVIERRYNVLNNNNNVFIFSSTSTCDETYEQNRCWIWRSQSYSYFNNYEKWYMNNKTNTYYSNVGLTIRPIQ